MLATRNMKLYLPFERNANDFSGNGNNGIVAGATLVDGGKFGKCYSFDAVDDRIASPELNGFTEKFSIGCWFKSNLNNTAQFILTKHEDVSFTPSQNRRQWIFRLQNNNTLAFNYYQGGLITNRESYNTVDSFSANSWYFAFLTFDINQPFGSRVKMYVNAVEITTTVTTAGNPTSITDFDNPIGIGALVGRSTSTPPNLYTFSGLIDNVVCFDNVVLNQSDIKRIMLNLHPLNG